jgi:DNA mismatch repair protein MutL
MSKITVLPESLANIIAAGEVVERPASVVKELLENALDAAARTIRIEVESGGKRLIRVVDDGEGMSRDDAITAFERHATSKLRNPEDLESISTLGFRGEALPSIASVSRLRLRTRTERDFEGTEVEFSGGKLVAVNDIAWASGTEVEVKDLFFNVPARRKFLKSDATESYHITNLVQHYALARPELSFLLVNNGRDAVRVEPATTLKDRAYQVIGGALLDKLVEINAAAGGLSVRGFVSNPQEQRSSRDAQYLFVNGRFVRDQLIGRALSEAYRSMMPGGTFPAAVLFVDAPASEVDVNVHPAKTEVRFLHASLVLAFIRDAVAAALKITRPITRVPGFERTFDAEEEGDSVSMDRVSALASGDVSIEATGGWSSQAPSVFTPAPRGEAPRAEPGWSDPAVEGLTEEAGPGWVADEPSEFDNESDDAYMREGGVQEPTQGPGVSQRVPLPGLGHGIKPLGQIRDSYIVATDEEGLLLIDQHVAHERVLFERFRDGKLAVADGVQPLLIPEAIDLSPAESEAFEAVQDELEEMGIEVMRLSGRSIAVKAVPSGLPAASAVALLREILTAVERDRRSLTPEHLRDEVAATVACKAAIKVNMPLTSEKMQWLIDELMRTQNPMTCPHGRPIIMRVGLRDIERGFKRPV